DWLRRAVERITAETGWAEDWFNDGVAFHLSPIADHAIDHLEFGSFPRDGTQPGLIVYVPSAPYLLALKLKAIRVTDPLRGEQERLDILNLMRVVGIRTINEAIAVLARYFPTSGASAEKQRFLLKHMNIEGAVDAPKYLSGGGASTSLGSPPRQTARRCVNTSALPARPSFAPIISLRKRGL